MKKEQKVVLITGAARRIGAQIAETLNQQGMKVIIHCRQSVEAATALAKRLNDQHPDSARVLQADLSDSNSLQAFAQQAVSQWQRLDVLVNNASAFYPTVLSELKEAQWNELLTINMRVPLFLSKYLADELTRRQGCIVNIGDIHAIRPLKAHPVYSATKAGLLMLSKALALELAPHVRCNAVSPGAILWPEHDQDKEKQKDILERTVLKRTGAPNDIASAVSFLIFNADYMTGQTLVVDGGRTLRG